MTKPTSGDGEVTALRQEIAQTRAELGETVEALAAKADVKAHAQKKVEETKARVAEVVAETRGKAMERAQHVAESGRELAREIKEDPAVGARHVFDRLTASIREYPKEWAIGAGILAFVVMMARRGSRRGRS
jgi:hypothetical protein